MRIFKGTRITPVGLPHFCVDLYTTQDPVFRALPISAGPACNRLHGSAKGRPPATGDYCMTCPAEWRRGIGGYHADGYKPRTVPHVAAVKAEEGVA